MRPFEGPDGIRWGVEARSPGASNVMIVFHHPDGRTSRNDRYAWYNWHGPESRSVTARIDLDSALKSLSDVELARLFRRSMRVAASPPPYNPSA